MVHLTKQHLLDAKKSMFQGSPNMTCPDVFNPKTEIGTEYRIMINSEMYSPERVDEAEAFCENWMKEYYFSDL